MKKNKNKIWISFGLITGIPVLLAFLVSIFFTGKEIKKLRSMQEYGAFAEPIARKSVWIIFICVVLLIVITAIALSIWTRISFISPIRKLEAATKKISDGDLNFELENNRGDEIGELIDDFEYMRKQLKLTSEEQVRQEQQYRIMISNICHDLKTPITVIRGHVEGIIDGVANTPEKQEKYIKTIYNKANDMNTLINELTIYSKLDTNRVPYNFQKLNLKNYMIDCCDELSDELETQGVGFSFDYYCSDTIEIIADPEQLHRVINNMISNAVKYMDKEKKIISIRVKDVGDFVQIEIEDNGKGISAKDLPYIFDRFFRADSSRSQTTGSGIGLSIVHKIMEDHGGKVWATSKEGLGTTMYFVLRKYEEIKHE